MSDKISSIVLEYSINAFLSFKFFNPAIFLLSINNLYLGYSRSLAYK